VNPHPLNDISFLIIQAAIEVHRILGPGLLESVYRACLIYELRERGLKVVAEQVVPLCYKGLVFDTAYRVDLLVENDVIVEVKAIGAGSTSVLPEAGRQTAWSVDQLQRPGPG
jgi:GxxExxY protein